MAGRGGRGRWTSVGVIAVASLVLLPGVARASGGGGCGRPVTDAQGTSIDIQGFCFTPSILRVEPGAEITFTNMDPVPHTVLGANGSWGGYDWLKKNHEATYRFSEPGVYAYVCTIHPGMVGVVVVGNGVGGAIGEATARGPVAQVLSASPASAVAATNGAGTNAARGGWPTFVLGALALLALESGAIAVVRRRRRSVA